MCKCWQTQNEINVFPPHAHPKQRAVSTGTCGRLEAYLAKTTLPPHFSLTFFLTSIKLLQATIGRKYFVETQTIVASFGPSDLSLIFISGMGLEVTPL